MRTTFTLPELDYKLSSLVGTISNETMEYHFNKHYATYLENLNRLIEGTRYADMTLEDIVRESSGSIFNNAGQALNHQLYFENLSPVPALLEPTGELLEAIELSFGSFGGMKEQFAQAAITLFGSGWVFLTLAGRELEIVSCANGGNPIVEGRSSIMVVDVWEHAYYLDHQNRRTEYITSIWGALDWAKIQARYECLMHKKAINQF